jgi:hypothetical protein
MNEIIPRKLFITAAVIALGCGCVATDALARGGGGGHGRDLDSTEAPVLYGGTYAYPYADYYGYDADPYGSYAYDGSCWQSHRVRARGAWYLRRQWVCG